MSISTTMTKSLTHTTLWYCPGTLLTPQYAWPSDGLWPTHSLCTPTCHRPGLASGHVWLVVSDHSDVLSAVRPHRCLGSTWGCGGVGDVITRCRDVITNLLKPSRALMGMCCRRCFLDRICLRAPKACSMNITITGLVLLGLLEKTEIKLGLIIVNCSLWLDSVITY